MISVLYIEASKVCRRAAHNHSSTSERSALMQHSYVRSFRLLMRIPKKGIMSPFLTPSPPALLPFDSTDAT